MHALFQHRLISCSQNLSGRLKHVKGEWGEGYPDADQCRLMVDRLCCYLFLQQQQHNEEEQPLQIAFSGQPSVDHGIFSSVLRLRASMGDAADRVLLLLFLMKGEGQKFSSADPLSHHSTPVRSRQLLPVPSTLPTMSQHPMSSVFLPSLSRPDSLVAIHPLGEMQVSCRASATLPLKFVIFFITPQSAECYLRPMVT